jgi:succinyl-diaminopimelate desuccinylase
MPLDPTELSKELISCPSVTPVDAGAIALLDSKLSALGFNCKQYLFDGDGSEEVNNLYAELGKGKKHLCFAGHTDIVPPGDLLQWRIDPFQPQVIDNILFGRGASDMKCAIACFAAATSRFLEKHADFDGKISFLITGDEEGDGINGTKKLLQAISAEGVSIDACLVGEPTSSLELGDTIKIGRRGSVSFELTVLGKQGHVAYPQLACNPISRLNRILHALDTHNLDDGTDHFDPSNLEIISIDVGNTASNVIPSTAQARFNIRFNDKHSGEKLVKWIRSICESICEDGDISYTLNSRISGEAFLTKPGLLSDIASVAVEKNTNKKPELSTSGGTSDARFIKDYCPVIELGMRNATAHKVDECVSVDDINLLTDIYYTLLVDYFSA